MKPKKLVLSAMFLAIGLILPFFTSQIKEIGDTLLPMHLPVLLCGLVCGPCWGLAVGFIMPLLRSVLFGMPPFYPNAIWMAFELSTYGGVIGILYFRKEKTGGGYLYFCLISAMIAGRVVWGIAKTILLGLASKPFTFQMFWAGGILDAIPGIVLQLILIPVIIGMIRRKK